MNTIARNAVRLLLVFALLAAPAAALASCPAYGGSGISMGSGELMGQETWSFTLINLTRSNIQIGAKGSTDNDLGDSFPYGVTFPPANTTKTQINLDTWKSDDHNQLVPDHCYTTVPFIISSNQAYNFSLRFTEAADKGRKTKVLLQPPYNQTTWKYSMNTSSNGYYALPLRAGETSMNLPVITEGIMFAISDNYILCLYKTKEPKDNNLILVVTERVAANDYHGNKTRYLLN